MPTVQAHLLLVAVQFPLQHLAVVFHRRKITLEIGLVARGRIGEVRVSRAVRERLRVCCGVHCDCVNVWVRGCCLCSIREIQLKQ